jgi:hypothetical protein
VGWAVRIGGVLAAAAGAEAGLIHLGRTYGSTPRERTMPLPGDDVIAMPKVQTDFVLRPVDDGRRTRFHFRSRWVTDPWWFTAVGWLGVVPANFVMAKDMLRGVRQRAERTAPPAPRTTADRSRSGSISGREGPCHRGSAR